MTNLNASEMGKLRWSKSTPEQIKAHMQMMSDKALKSGKKKGKKKSIAS